MTLTAVGLAIVTRGTSLALVAPPPEAPPEDPKKEILISHEISANHGHDFILTETEVLKALRLTSQPDQIFRINIQGKSGHPHVIDLNQDNLMNLIVQGEVLITSSKDAGHAHSVRIKMEMTFDS